MPIINNSKTDPNKILPMKYLWARQYYKDGIANNWTPEEISMHSQERRLILWNLGFFATAESLTANNLVLAVYRHVTNPECRQYLLRQSFEEAVHTDTFIYCCDSLGLNPDEIYNMYLTIPSIKEKDDFVVELTKSIFDPNFSTEGEENIRRFLHDLIGYYVIMEGIFFYAGFAMMLALKRANKMVGIGQQFEYIMRDESLHLAFGFVELIKKSVELEKQYAVDACPQGIVGINSQQFCKYVEYIADRRLERIDLPKVYQTNNPFPWMSQATDLNKEKNFFETRPTEYQTGGRLE
ncbi:1142_t:CDS:2 [Funneliformis geosporum]|uniref:10163_t:CDS:1 n=1 Tax=Funneliformis geosporum TaxID=1117311 RepID=A0A9W4T9W2_9GLOM|nr:1142_t:CDS:2 [Funneliformis geosporum]CAI2197771.1 10163_t:CDS:2 [Funneliformis geosporum]